MVHYINLELNQPICPMCAPFTIHGANQLTTKLAGLETHLRAVRPQWSPSHQEYVSLVQGISFVILAQPISTKCTIVGDVDVKLQGVSKSSSSKGKAKVGQGDYKSIVFWTKEQSMVMMWDQQFVVFSSPWSTGKTICQREKARSWATDNPNEKLYFCVVRDDATTNTSLLEVELKLYFKEHKVSNVTVLGQPSNPFDMLLDLHNTMQTMPAGSWMFDEIAMPSSYDYKEWSQELQKMRSCIEGQPGNLLLWISIAYIFSGRPEQFKHSFLAPLMPGFHMPMMEYPLRNTGEIIKFAGLDSQNTNKIAAIGHMSMNANPCYSLPSNLMSGIPCQQIIIKKDDDVELENALEYACKTMMQRTRCKGFPVLFDDMSPNSDPPSNVVAAVKRIVGDALLYTHTGKNENEATEAEVEEWVRRWKMGEETRALITGQHLSRGWEAPAVLVIGSQQKENLIMRTCGFCFLINVVKPQPQPNVSSLIRFKPQNQDQIRQHFSHHQHQQQ